VAVSAHDATLNRDNALHHIQGLNSLTPTQASGCACAGREVAQCAGRMAMRGGPTPISQTRSCDQQSPRLSTTPRRSCHVGQARFAGRQGSHFRPWRCSAMSEIDHTPEPRYPSATPRSLNACASDATTCRPVPRARNASRTPTYPRPTGRRSRPQPRRPTTAVVPHPSHSQRSCRRPTALSRQRRDRADVHPPRGNHPQHHQARTDDGRGTDQR
jgi:hypothetical protein